MPDQTMRERVTDQTPTTEEHATVRLGTEIQRYAEGFPRSDFSRVAEALAAHDRAVKVEVLREVATVLRQQPSTPGERGLAAWLDTRANRIGAGRG